MRCATALALTTLSGLLGRAEGLTLERKEGGTGYFGVYRDKRTGRFQARLKAAL